MHNNFDEIIVSLTVKSLNVLETKDIKENMTGSSFFNQKIYDRWYGVYLRYMPQKL
jgi:hypothetical protein